MPNIQNTIFNSSFAGLAQTEDVSFSTSVPASSYTAGQQKTFSASTTMTSSGDIPDVQCKLTGISSKWFWLAPLAQFYYPEGSTSATATYFMTIKTYFVGSTIKVDIAVLEWAFSAGTSPAFTLDCRAYVDTAPF